jgi:hypothetical protein
MTRRLPWHVTAAGAALAILAACDGQRISADRQAKTAADSAEQLLYNASTVLTANGVRRGDIHGDTVATFESMTRFRFRRIEVRFTTATGRPLAVLTAPFGEYWLATGTLVTADSVRVVSDTSGRRLVTEALRYEVARNQLVSNGSFTATSGTRSLTGVEFTSDPGLFTIKCAARCVGSLGVAGGTAPRPRPPAAPRRAPAAPAPVPTPPRP